MPRRLISTDLDGTIVFNGSIPLRDREAMARWRADGNLLVINTGRSVSAWARASPASTMNRALARDKDTGKEQSITISEQGNLDQSEVERMLAEAERNRGEDEELRKELETLCDQMVSPVRVKQSTKLSARELDVLSCVALGHTNVEAAEEMGIGAETVKSYLRSVMRKLGAHTRYEAVNAARRIGALP